MTVVDDVLAADLRPALEPLLGGPVRLSVLKDKPGRRRTSRAVGPRGSAVVKVYASGRAPVVASRLTALQRGPADPAVPAVLLLDAARHLVVIGELSGMPLSTALTTGADATTGARAAARAGAALARWHHAHRTTCDPSLREHTAEKELDVLLQRAASAPPSLRRRVEREAAGLAAGWAPTTVVHRDLYEDQVLLGQVVALVDLDDAARGPGELDLGNALAHLRLRALRGGPPGAAAALLRGYRTHVPVDEELLERCTRLSLLRLACLHAEPGLL